MFRFSIVITKTMNREEIEQLDTVRPYSFETDREEWWYNIGLIEGLETADQQPRKGLWDSEKVIDFIKKHWVWNKSVIESLRKAMKG